MPKREDLGKILIIGSGPIVIGQAAEFDFSGSQACKALREEEYYVVLVNSNPATIQTDPSMADRTYIEPLIPETVAQIIEKEKVEGILSGMGGQTSLNICAELSENGFLDSLGVELLGTDLEAIKRCEDRELFRDFMAEIGEPIPRSGACTSLDSARETAEKLGGYPVVIRPAYTLGGTGGGIAYDMDELESIVKKGLTHSRIGQVLVEECLIGWGEYEYEVIRDSRDNCIAICSMENIDPMSIHTGDSIVVAPAQTLSDDDHQLLRSSALRIIRRLEVGGGCNVQFAFNSRTGEYRVIEVNPRVSRSSALASKATGYPIARVSAKIAVGMTLDEIPNRVTDKTPASFEPALDYVVIKMPRWPFDKFKRVDRHIGTQMKSTGEAMAIARNLEECFQKAMRSLDIDSYALDRIADGELLAELEKPTDTRIFGVLEAFRRGWPMNHIANLTRIDPFFLGTLKNIVDEKQKIAKRLTPEAMGEAKRLGFSDEQLSKLLKIDVREYRERHGIRPVYKMVDTCAAEFEAKTPYYYSTYDGDGSESSGSSQEKKVLVIGSGPIRIGQGIEFDYCCVQSAQALHDEGVLAIMINNNPETVSTDFDQSDKLYFEPLTLEDVLNVIHEEMPWGIILQFGGQKPIDLALPLQKEIDGGLKMRILGTSPDSIELAENRDKFSALLLDLGIPHPPSGAAHSVEDARRVASQIGYPILARPSYVLGGRGMEVLANEVDLDEYIAEALRVSGSHPVLVDRFIENAIEVDVDCVADGEDVYIGGIMEHIEEAGIHSGDSSCVIPPITLSDETVKTIKEYTKKIASALKVKGLLNLQFAVKKKGNGSRNGAGLEGVYVLEANPRASRTIPFVSKATGVPMAKVATQVMLGRRLKDLIGKGTAFNNFAVKIPVFPFQKLEGADPRLGPEMRSTGEVMAISDTFGEAFYKAMIASGNPLPSPPSTIFISVADRDKSKILPYAKGLHELGYELIGTRGTADALKKAKIPMERAWKISEGRCPNAIDLIRSGKVELVVNTPSDGTKSARRDGYHMRRAAIDLAVPFISTISALSAAVESLGHCAQSGVKPLNEWDLEDIDKFRQ